MASLSSQVKGSLAVDPSIIVSGAPAPVITIDNGSTMVSNYPMHWPSPPTTGYIAPAVPYNNGNPSPINVIYNGTTYTPTPASVIIPGTGAVLTVNLTLP